METFHFSYESIMAIPTTRRHRLLQMKVDLEKKREQRLNQK